MSLVSNQQFANVIKLFKVVYHEMEKFVVSQLLFVFNNIKIIFSIIRVCHNSCIDFLISDNVYAHLLEPEALLFFLIKYWASAKVRVLLWMFFPTMGRFHYAGRAKKERNRCTVVVHSFVEQ